MSGSEVLQSYAEQAVKRAQKMARLKEKMDRVLDNELARNGNLSMRAPGLLKIIDTITVAPLDFVPDPLNQGEVGRFAWGFHIAESFEGDKRIPIRTETLLALPSMFEPGRFDRARDHRSRPAFYRGLALFPEFFIPLTTEISDSVKPPAHIGPDLYVAYNVMSRLIDSRDPGALKPDGTPDSAYLFKPTPSIEFDHLRSVG